MSRDGRNERRLALIRLGERALREIERGESSESSYVFEDAFREFAPQRRQYTADYIAEHRGFTSEALHIRHALKWLSNLPWEERLDRLTAEVERVLSNALRRYVIKRSDDQTMPILYNPRRSVESYLNRAPWYSKRQLTDDVIRSGFNLYPSSPDSKHRLAKRVADVLWRDLRGT